MTNGFSPSAVRKVLVSLADEGDQHVAFPVVSPRQATIGDLRSHSRRGVERRNFEPPPAAARPACLGCQLHLEFAREVLPGELLFS